MLQKNAVNEKTYFLLKKLMEDNKLNDFVLVGGTALALQIGHRESVDIDLFTRKNIDVNALMKYFNENYNFDMHYIAENTLKGFIDGVLVDCIKYDYPYIDKIEEYDSIRHISMKDITAMKLMAIINDGTRMKDFIDIAYLSNHFSLDDMIRFCEMKFGGDWTFSIIKGITYFDDIEETNDIKVLNNQFSFTKIKNRILDMVENPKQVFDKNI